MSRSIIVGIIACVAFVAFASSCSIRDDAPTQGDSSGTQSGPRALEAEQPVTSAPGCDTGGAPHDAVLNRGRVISATVAGRYAYLELEVRGGRVWLATTPVEVRPGDEVGWGNFAPMNDFTSEALGRTFEQILFVSNVFPLNARASSEGLVVSVQAAGGYSYVEVEREGGNLWLATPETALDAGDRIRWAKGSPMRDFVSEPLGRTFPEIAFTAGVSVVE